MKLIPLAHNSKSPLKGDDWHNRISDDPDEHAHWSAQGYNRGMPLEENNRSVIDFDDKEAGREFYRKHKELCTVMVETRRGVHFHFAGKTATRKFEHGDIKGNGYVMWVGSQVNGWIYRLIETGPLQPFPEHLFPIERKEVNREAEPDGVLRVRRAEEYGKQVFAIAGSNGHNTTFRLVCFYRDIGLTEGEAYLVLERWNETNTDPKWTPKEMTHKVKSAYRQKGGSNGHSQTRAG